MSRGINTNASNHSTVRTTRYSLSLNEDAHNLKEEKKSNESSGGRTRQVDQQFSRKKKKKRRSCFKAQRVFTFTIKMEEDIRTQVKHIHLLPFAFFYLVSSCCAVITTTRQRQDISCVLFLLWRGREKGGSPQHSVQSFSQLGPYFLFPCVSLVFSFLFGQGLIAATERNGRLN